ncbi:hypothetical protein ACN4EK_14850 [Pantanalinema rosaneae CENA516]|uniref:hypothetical protein n=1 Tax=Pantanalinema rosaneae TaxID=1620701 RepID=UPI003D6E48D0
MACLKVHLFDRGSLGLNRRLGVSGEMQLLILLLILSLAIGGIVPSPASEFPPIRGLPQPTVTDLSQLPLPPDTGSPSRPARGGGTY